MTKQSFHILVSWVVGLLLCGHLGCGRYGIDLLDTFDPGTADSSGDTESSPASDLDTDTDTDGNAATDSDSETGTEGVLTLPPWAHFTVSPTSGTGATIFAFDASTSHDSDDPNASLVFEWDYDGDGTYDASGETVDHTFNQEQKQTVTLRVTDTGGMVGIYEAYVVVSAAASVIQVTTSQDVVDGGDGVLSLREAIDLANTTPGPNTISFAGPMTIQLTGTLPQLTDVDTTVVGSPGVVIEGGLGDCLQTDTVGTGRRFLWLEIHGCQANGVSLGGANDEVAFSVIHTNGGRGVISTGNNALIGPANHIYGNTNDGVDIAGLGAEVFGNRIHDNSGDGIQVQNASDGIVIIQNTIFGNTEGIVVPNNADNCRILNNTVHDNSDNGLNLSASGLDVRGNIFSNNRVWAIETQAASFSQIDYNNFFENLTGDCDNCPLQPNSISLDPVYADSAGGDLRLMPGSPCVDAAVDLSFDLNGPRPNDYDGLAPDMGSWESPY